MESQKIVFIARSSFHVLYCCVKLFMSTFLEEMQACPSDDRYIYIYIYIYRIPALEFWTEANFEGQH
ncbi:unnamed protein product [Rhizophagus irregularis]|uniref:Uncharacterized protein n=1 Tax=Rhizophagus irregularis TaxID=588596 RepID=A0A916E8Q5_9GLOM|nr:unnamed protein product [Rhizophagus irregularis]